MNNKIIYSNNLTKTIAAIKTATSEKYRKKFVFITNSGYFYIYNGGKYKTQEEAIKELKKQGYKKEDIRFVEQWGSSYLVRAAMFVMGDNGNWIDVVYLSTNRKLQELSLFELCRYGLSIVRIYKDYRFKRFTKTNSLVDISEDSFKVYLGNGENEANPQDLTIGLCNHKSIYQSLPLGLNDIDSLYQLSDKSYNDYKRKLSDKTIKMLKEVFDLGDSEITKWQEFRDYIKTPRSNTYNKASITKKALLDGTFIPIINKIKRVERKLDEVEKREAEQSGYTMYGAYYNSAYFGSFHRIGDWILYAGVGSRYLFFNVKNNKKYLVNYYKDSNMWHSSNIGVFNPDFIIEELSQYNRPVWCNKVSFYTRGSYGASDLKEVHVIDAKYARCPLCFDENNNEISPFKCFAGTIVPDFLEVEKDWLMRVKFGYGSELVDVGIISDIVKLNRCPGLAFLALCISKNKIAVVEQMFKLKLNGILLSLLNDPASFRDKTVEDTDGYWTRNSFCDFDPAGTNLKKMFNFPLDKLRIYDNTLLTAFEEKLDNGAQKVGSIKKLQEFIGDSLMSMDNGTFEKYISYFKNNHNYMYNIDVVRRLFSNKSPKDFIETLEKVGDLSVYTDYIRIRTQYLNYFEADERVRLEASYKVLPEKAKKFKYLRETSEPWTSRIITREQQLEKISKLYKHVIPVYQNGAILGVQLDLTSQEHTHFLHDELYEFCNAHRSELQEKGFKNAATRLLKYEYKGQDLSIVAPKESKDLAIEGSVLHHCVGGFIDSVIRGSETVLFIRRNDNLSHPYFTIAIDPKGNIEQIHGYFNSSLTEAAQENNYKESKYPVYDKTFDLVRFLKEWARNKKDIINGNTIKDQYGALRAH